MGDAEVADEFAAVECPGKVGETQAPVAHRPGHAEAGGGDLVASQKLLDDVFQARIILGRKSLFARICQLSIGEVIQRQVNLGAAHVSGQNHLSLSKTPQPSPSVGGRSAAAALSRNRVSIPLAGQIS